MTVGFGLSCQNYRHEPLCQTNISNFKKLLKKFYLLICTYLSPSAFLFGKSVLVKSWSEYICLVNRVKYLEFKISHQTPERFLNWLETVVLCHVPKLSLLQRTSPSRVCLGLSPVSLFSNFLFLYISFLLFPLETFCSNLDCLQVNFKLRHNIMAQESDIQMSKSGVVAHTCLPASRRLRQEAFLGCV